MGGTPRSPCGRDPSQPMQEGKPTLTRLGAGRRLGANAKPYDNTFWDFCNSCAKKCCYAGRMHFAQTNFRSAPHQHEHL
jgi:hypothetical protein